MKTRNFLKMAAIMIAGLMLMGLNSCTKKPCEKDNFGTVIVTNHTGQVIWVDCTQEGSEYNDERMLGLGMSTTYQMRPGQITEWALKHGIILMAHGILILIILTNAKLIMTLGPAKRNQLKILKRISLKLLNLSRRINKSTEEVWCNG